MAGAAKTNYFAISEAAISAYVLNQAASWVTMDVAAESSIELAMTEAPVTDGEGRIVDQWYHSQRATGRLRLKRMATQVLELLTGNPVSSVSGGEKILFGIDSEINPPLFRLRLKARARDAVNDTSSFFYVYLYRVKGMLTGYNFAETTPAEFNFNFTALLSSNDDLGATLPGNGAFGHSLFPKTA